MKTRSFVLIDLYNQREAVKQFVRGWTREQILEWMSLYGNYSHSPDLSHWYSFTSRWGFPAIFGFDEEDQIWITFPR